MTGQETLRQVRSTEDLERLIDESATTPQWLLKHSLICPVSAQGKREFERFAGSRRDATFSVIEIQRARSVSAEAAERLEVRHESPQALLIVGGEVLWHGSHWSITSQALAAAANEGSTSEAD